MGNRLITLFSGQIIAYLTIYSQGVLCLLFSRWLHKEKNVFAVIDGDVRDKLVALRTEMIHRQHQHIHPEEDDTVMKSVPEGQSKITKFTCPYWLYDRLHSNQFKLVKPTHSLNEVVYVDILHTSCLDGVVSDDASDSSSRDSHVPNNVTSPLTTSYRQKLCSGNQY